MYNRNDATIYNNMYKSIQKKDTINNRWSTGHSIYNQQTKPDRHRYKVFKCDII